MVTWSTPTARPHTTGESQLSFTLEREPYVCNDVDSVLGFLRWVNMGSDRRFGFTYCLHLQGQVPNTAHIHTVQGAKSTVNTNNERE